ncbi:peptidoglycan-associated lipoprotein Pal [Thiomicrospira microaerophila]|uniref:peptidoglycan-associated lipoprotein Pal n=1 Tax=Thiomicrospira microaerophila TaxID=406020 RepID=UPI00200C81E7|nr:peptidoglycan-associated lipoprotein Pal [Thiomicrospira microaerophila]UQB41695.1 peptidoglycan-associated lipoprotein Pal [Thiomicrospira microaerophila]
MEFLRIKNVAVVSLVSLFAVGCSSTPTSDQTDQSVVQTGSMPSTAGVATSKPVVAEGLEQDQASRVAELFASLQGKRVHFEFDRAEIKQEYLDVIKKHAQYLELNPNARLTIEGHCDERGTREYNLALGERRGNAVKDALMAQGVNPNRLNVISFGKDMPLVDLSNEQAWQQNRRAEFAY